MATLQTSRIGISSPNSFGSFVERHNKCFSLIRQVGFASLYRQRRRKVDSLCIGKSYTDRNAHGGGFSASQDGSSAVEDGKKGKGLLLGTERDGSGSVVGFHLIPQSVTGDEKFMESTVRDPNGRDDVSAEIGMEDQPSARVTHNVVFVTAEASPYSKTGGLGDVCGSLPIALPARGHRVMVVSPRYSDGSPSDKRFSNAVVVQPRKKWESLGIAWIELSQDCLPKRDPSLHTFYISVLFSAACYRRENYGGFSLKH